MPGLLVKTSGNLRSHLQLRRRFKGLINFLSGREYPSECGVTSANDETLNFIRSTQSLYIAEIGIYEGHTSSGFAEYLNGKGELHLFDFEDTTDLVKKELEKKGYDNIFVHGNSHKSLDSYNWSLMRLIEQNEKPIFDYIFLDGAHTWNIDALTFFLADKLLKVGGYMDFDDYSWSIKTSPSLNPTVFPLSARLYTSEQIEEKQVKLIVDLLVKRSRRFTEVKPNKIYQKIRSDQ